MYNKLSDRPFLLIYTIRRPANGVHSHKKNYMNVTGNMETFEQTSIVDRIKTKHLQEAFVIIDILQNKVITHKFKSADNQKANEEAMIDHFLTKYESVCQKGLKAYFAKKAKEVLTPENIEKVRKNIETNSD